jgi:hypothetical protein
MRIARNARSQLKAGPFSTSTIFRKTPSVFGRAGATAHVRLRFCGFAQEVFSIFSVPKLHPCISGRPTRQEFLSFQNLELLDPNTMQSFCPSRHLFGPNATPSLTAVTLAEGSRLSCHHCKARIRTLKGGTAFAIIIQKNEALHTNISAFSNDRFEAGIHRSKCHLTARDRSQPTSNLGSLEACRKSQRQVSRCIPMHHSVCDTFG